jgi:hypothetical protein
MDSAVRAICKALMFLPFHLVLKGLIIKNYRMRQQGLLPDEWYWADSLACRFGYFVEISP